MLAGHLDLRHRDYGTEEGAAMATTSFIRARHNGTLDDEATKIMGDAFDAACAMLGKISKPEREVVADRIVELAMTDERDPARLRDAGISALRSRAARHY